MTGINMSVEITSGIYQLGTPPKNNCIKIKIYNFADGISFFRSDTPILRMNQAFNDSEKPTIHRLTHNYDVFFFLSLGVNESILRCLSTMHAGNEDKIKRNVNTVCHVHTSRSQQVGQQ